MASLVLRNMRQSLRQVTSRSISTSSSSSSCSSLSASRLSTSTSFRSTTRFTPVRAFSDPATTKPPPVDEKIPTSGPFNEGDAPGIVPRSEYQATGREFRELLWRTRFGEEYYSREAAGGHFGTMEEPAIIFSNFASRVVGCMGGHTEGLIHHELMWFELSRGRKHMCSICGQVFKLGGDWLYDTNYECYETEQAEWMKLRVKFEAEREKKIRESKVLVPGRKFHDPFAPKTETAEKTEQSASKGHH